jgi:LysM repeat protein
MRKTLLLLFISYTLASLAVIAQAEHLRPVPLAAFVVAGASLLMAGLAAVAIEAPYLPGYFDSLKFQLPSFRFKLPDAAFNPLCSRSSAKPNWCLPVSAAERRRAARRCSKKISCRAGTHASVLLLVVIVTSLARPDLPLSAHERREVAIARATGGRVAALPHVEPAAPSLRPRPFREDEAVARQAQPLTQIPSRLRGTIITYTVQPGDTLFGIALYFDLEPETILWANPDLQSEPDFLQVETALDILPIDGVAHVVQAGDTVQSLAVLYQSSAEAIMTAEWNSIPPGRQPEAGQRLIIPGGKRELAVWQFPSKPSVINPRLVQDYKGFCDEVVLLPMAGGTFIWPTDDHRLTGNPYTWWHRAIDLAGKSGDPVYASDGGTVIYAGWNTWGYGKLVVIEHGDGWQSWYAHLSKINVQCGQHFYQGALIGDIGSTGRSSGPHLHFEIRHDDELLNPLDMLE